MATPLFGFGTTALGLNGIQQGLAVQASQLALQQQVRDNARDYIDFASQLDQLGQFADFRQQGATPAQALFAQSQGSFNPLTAQAGLNNFVNRSGQLAPFAIAAAQQGNPGLLNSIGSGPGVQFDASNPLSGFENFGAQGAGAQAQFAIRNNLLGGALNNPAAAPVQQAAPAPQSAFNVDPGLAAQQNAIAQQQAIAQQYNPVQNAAVQQAPVAPAVQQQQFAVTQAQAVPQAQPTTRIQQNSQQIQQAIQQATQAPRQNVFNVDPGQAAANRAITNPQSQRQEAVTFPTVDNQSEVRRQAEEEERRIRLASLQRNNGSFESIFRGI